MLLSKETQLMLEIIKRGVFPGGKNGIPYPEPGGADLKTVYEEMRIQTVQLLADGYLPYLSKTDPELSEMWRSENTDIKAIRLRIMIEQNGMLELLSANGIKCAVIKGSSAAVYYPAPELRAQGDVDVIVKDCDFERAAALLERNGYRLKGEYEEYHRSYIKNAVEIELHKRIGGVSAGNSLINTLINNAIDNREFKDLNGFRIPVLPDLYNGLVLLLHINQHLHSGIGLRHMIDFMMFADKCIDERSWKEEYEPLFEKTGLKTLAAAVIKTCRTYLGYEKESSWCDGSDGGDCDELMEYVLEAGNFGRRSGEDGHVSTVFFDVKNPARFFKRMHEGGMKRWSAARKHAILRPFAWIYQSVCVLSRLRKDKINAKKLSRLRKKGKKHRKLIKRLGLKTEI